MRILVSDDTGLIRNVDVEEKKLLGTFGEQRQGMAVSHIERVEESYFVASHEDSHLRIFSLLDNSYTYECKLPNNSEVVSLSYRDSHIYTVQKNGDLSSISVQYEEDMPYFDEPKSIYKINATQVNRAKFSPYAANSLCILSKDTNPQIVDVESGEMTWKAKNVKNDHLDLAVPIFDMDLDFASENELYVCTAYRKIRLYDVRVKNCKPVKDIQDKHDKYGYNNCLLGPDKNYFYVSDKSGNIQVLDVRRDMMMVGKLKGALGSIKSMVLSKNHPYIAAVSLDRYARIYNTNTNKLFRKIYLKHKLTGVAILEDVIDEDADEEVEENRLIKKYDGQNETKKKAQEFKTKIKESRVRLTFEVKKKVKTENEDQVQETNYENEYEEEDNEEEEN